MKVWDALVRVGHWTLAASVILAWITHEGGGRWHEWLGYVALAAAMLRIVWGFVGPHHARFTVFVRSPREAVGYLRDARLLRARRYIGHNPAGGLMVVALIVALAGCCVTGYLMTTDAYWGSSTMEDIHGALANATVALVVLHVLGVLVASFEHRENLVKSMVTGRKRAD